MREDKFDFRLKPSQWVNFGWLILMIVPMVFGQAGLVIGGIFGLLWIWKYFVINCWMYDFHERTITEQKGVFTIRKQEIHFFRIKSIRVKQPFLHRLVGLVTYIVITSDPLIPIFTLYAIEDNGELRNILKSKATQARKEMGVKETDFHNF